MRTTFVSLTLFLFFFFIGLVVSQNCEQSGIHVSKSVLDGLIKEVYYASEDQTDIYVLTEVGTVYRSTDRGVTWLNKMNSFPQWDNSSLSYNGHLGVKHIKGSGKSHIVYFEGHGFSFWTTRGDDVYKLYTLGAVVDGEYYGNLVYKFDPHPTEPSSILRMMYTSDCFDFSFGYCSVLTQVSEFEGADGSWLQINDYSFKAEWGVQSDNIIVQSIDEEYQLNSILNPSIPDSQKNLIVFENFGRDEVTTIPNVLDFVVVNDVVYFAKMGNDGEFSTFVTSDILSATELQFLGGGNYQVSYYSILPSTSDVSFIAVHTAYGDVGNLYQSSTNDGDYWASLENIRMNGAGADFYKTNDLPGVYIANQFDSIFLDDEHIRTRISFDNGGEWRNLTLNNSDESLNLFITSEFPSQRIQSSEQAVGIVYSLGTEGEFRLFPNEEDVGLYLSRNGGFSWERVHDGLLHFSFNDHASLLVATELESSASSLTFTWDQGLTWDTCSWGELSFDEFHVSDIVSLTNFPNGLQFLILGSFQNGQGMIASVDFSDAIPRICQLENDYETFTPALGNVCLLGEATSFLRRKRDSICVSPGVTQQQVSTYNCQCTRHDFQCDGSCFEEQKVEGELNSICVNICEGQDNDPTLPPSDCGGGNYYRTQGYKKVPGDVCVGGEEYLPILEPCPNDSTSLSPSASPFPSPEAVSPSPSTEPASLSPSPSAESASPSPSPFPSPSSEAVSPSSSVESASPSPSPSVEVISPSASVMESASPSDLPTPTTNSSASTTPTPEAVESLSLTPSTIPKSMSNSPSPSMTAKQSFSISMENSTEPATIGGESSVEATGEDTFPFWWIIVAAVIGIIGVCIVLVVAVVALLFVRKQQAQGGKKTKQTNYDEDVFSLEDNDEWEL